MMEEVALVGRVGACCSFGRVSTRGPGKSGLRMSWLSFSYENGSFRCNSATALINAKKQSIRSELLCGDSVAGPYGLPACYVFLRHVFRDKEPLYVFGSVSPPSASDPRSKPSFLPIKEFRDTSGSLAFANVERCRLLDGPTLVCPCEEKQVMFVGRINKKGRFVTHCIPYPAAGSDLVSFLLVQQSMLPGDGSAMVPSALFIVGTKQAPEAWQETNVTEDVAEAQQHQWWTYLRHFARLQVLRELRMEQLQKGGKGLCDFVCSGTRWELLPLHKASIKKPAQMHRMEGKTELDILRRQHSPDLMEEEEEDPLLSLDSGPVEETNAAEDEAETRTNEWANVPNCFSVPGNIAAVVVVPTDEVDEQSQVNDSVIIGLRTSHLMEFKHGILTSFRMLPAPPLFMGLARTDDMEGALVVQLDEEQRTVQVLSLLPDHKFHIITEFNNIEQVSVADFMATGREQILMVERAAMDGGQKDGAEKVKDRFILTDVQSVWRYCKHKKKYKLDSKECIAGGAPASRSSLAASFLSLQSVAHSLQSRLKKAQIERDQACQRMEKKKQLLSAAYDTLSTAVSVRKHGNIKTHSELTSDLVPLFQENKPNVATHSPSTLGASQPNQPPLFLSTSSLLSFYVDSGWMVIATLKNTTSHKLWCHSLFVSSPSGCGGHCATVFAEKNRLTIPPHGSATLLSELKLSQNNTVLRRTDQHVHVWVEYKLLEEEEIETIGDDGGISSLDVSAAPSSQQQSKFHSDIQFVGSVLLNSTQTLYSGPSSSLQGQVAGTSVKVVLLLQAENKEDVADLPLVIADSLSLCIQRRSNGDDDLFLLSSTSATSRPFSISIHSSLGSTLCSIEASNENTLVQVLTQLLSCLPQGMSATQFYLNPGLSLLWRLLSKLRAEIGLLLESGQSLEQSEAAFWPAYTEAQACTDEAFVAAEEFFLPLRIT